jgi:hypothetical protein
MNKILVILLPLALVVAVLTMAPLKADIDLDSIKLPPGFQIEVYAEEVDNARQITQGRQGACPG